MKQEKSEKKIGPKTPSLIEKDINSVSFCSNMYAEVDFCAQKRMMPMRSSEEVLSKVSLMLGYAIDASTAEAWARAQGFVLACSHTHMSELRLIAVGLLDATTVQEPWLGSQTPFDAFKHCYEGSSHYPMKADFSKVQVLSLTRFNIKKGPERHKWKVGFRRVCGAMKRWIDHNYYGREPCMHEILLDNEIN
ncbi:unnamed protein product [Toxocara canis]|uniref:Flavi_NS5_thumb domain-containing protein n=1 Tax=Toxocara canis TaxID=6265 RepID=A0A183U509_TOXCA|nr:unnamed protein product [Toxocara canis]